jgi:Cytochrome C oxidase, cbb3-type, subunit III
MAGRIFCIVILSFSVGARAGDQPPDSPVREADERARPAQNSVASRGHTLYHLAEGSEIFPLDWLLALKSAKTGKPFLEDPERFGLIPDPEMLDIPGHEGVRLPIGLTIGTPRDVHAAVAAIKRSGGPPDPLAMRMVGVNCAACHVGRLRYHGKDLPLIEGAPNVFNIDAFYQELFQSAFETVKKQDKLETFLNDLGKLGAKSEISKILLASFERIKKNPSGVLSALEKIENPLEVLQQAVTVLPNVAELLRELKPDDAVDSMNRFYEDSGLLLSRLAFLKTLASLHTSGEQVTSPGPGRIDAFGNVRRLYFRNAPKVSLDSPVSFPHLWGVRQTGWYHWDGNTNALMERNIGQAMGLGAIADLRTGASTILPLNLHELESFFAKVPPPEWPKSQFGPVDTTSEKYRTGARLYVQHCAKCHDRQEGGQKSHEGAITYDLQELGTDPLRAQNFATPLEKEKPFTDGLQAVAAKVKKHAIAANPGEHPDELDLPDHNIRWLTTRGYVARPLEGVWASPPYLHNGSVPTLDDLLKPENERPACFPVGHREYDPVKLGYVSEFDKVPVAERRRFFVYDTRIQGNSNKGHLYGTCISASEREALLEYLKVMNPRDVIAPVHPGEERALGMEDVAANEDADIRELKDLQIEQMKMEAGARGVKPTDRGQHPKHHGFLRARFTVLANLPAALRVGLFREPKTYAAVIRFSSTGEQDDRVLDNHGMAIKVLGVKPKMPDDEHKKEETTTQDFVLLDHPLFFTPNVATLVAFSREKKRLVLQEHLKGKELLEEMKKGFPKEVSLLEGRKQHIESPLETDYFSTTPYKLGATAVKYSAKPEDLQNYLREILVEQLRPREHPGNASTSRHTAARFGFYVQRQTDPSAMPIEDPTVEWTSPWENVAKIDIEAQDFDFPERWEWGNKLSFSPWHALEEHRPLGGINRARRIVYPASSELRHENLNAQ